MALRTCRVSFIDNRRVRHGVEVTAESLFEAAVLALSAFQEQAWAEGLGQASRLEVEVSSPATRHELTVSQVRAWLESTSASPSELVKKVRLRQLLK